MLSRIAEYLHRLPLIAWTASSEVLGLINGTATAMSGFWLLINQTLTLGNQGIYTSMTHHYSPSIWIAVFLVVGILSIIALVVGSWPFRITMQATSVAVWFYTATRLSESNGRGWIIGFIWGIVALEILEMVRLSAEKQLLFRRGRRHVTA